MTLNKHNALEQYFHKIIKPLNKEPSMWEKIKDFILDKLTKPDPDVVTEVTDKSSPYADSKDKIVVEMYTEGYYSWERQEEVPPVHTVFYNNMNSTWVEIVDSFLDELEKHFGYNIKDHVYYSLHHPMNLPELSAYGRQLNDERFQLLLLAHPELYENEPEVFEVYEK